MKYLTDLLITFTGLYVGVIVFFFAFLGLNISFGGSGVTTEQALILVQLIAVPCVFCAFLLKPSQLKPTQNQSITL